MKGGYGKVEDLRRERKEGEEWKKGARKDNIEKSREVVIK
jgi:hypothetical protein